MYLVTVDIKEKISSWLHCAPPLKFCDGNRISSSHLTKYHLTYLACKFSDPDVHVKCVMEVVDVVDEFLGADVVPMSGDAIKLNTG